MLNTNRFRVRASANADPDLTQMTYSGPVDIGGGVKKIVEIPVDLMSAKTFGKKYAVAVPSKLVLNVRGFVIALLDSQKGFGVFCGGDKFAHFENIEDALSCIYQSGIKFISAKHEKATKKTSPKHSFVRGDFVDTSDLYIGGPEPGNLVGLVLSSSQAVVSVFWLDTFKVVPHSPKELTHVDMSDVKLDIELLSKKEIAFIESKTKLKLPC